MVPPTPTPSSRLMRAAAAEREDIARHRERLVAARERLRAELAGVEASLRELDERDALLDRLAGGGHGAAARTTGAPAGGAPNAAAPAGPARVGAAPAVSGRRDGDRLADPAPVASVAGGAGVAAGPAAPGAPGGADGRRYATTLRGPAIRRTAVDVLRALPGRPQALHYRAWFDAVCAAGFDVAGKDPLAVFLTQLSRSPVVRRGTQSGVYELDLDAPGRLRERLEALHADLRRLSVAPSATTDLLAIRARRAAITTQITQVEKALEEAETLLGPIAGDGARVAATG